MESIGYYMLSSVEGQGSLSRRMDEIQRKMHA